MDNNNPAPTNDQPAAPSMPMGDQGGMPTPPAAPEPTTEGTPAMPSETPAPEAPATGMPTEETHEEPAGGTAPSTM